MTRAEAVSRWLRRIDRENGRPKNPDLIEAKQKLSVAGNGFAELLDSGEIDIHTLADVTAIPAAVVRDLIDWASAWQLADETGLSPRDLHDAIKPLRQKPETEQQRLAFLAALLREKAEDAGGHQS